MPLRLPPINRPPSTLILDVGCVAGCGLTPGAVQPMAGRPGRASKNRITDNPPTPAHGIQAAVTLVDRLQATPGNRALLAELTRVIAELQGNATGSQDKVAGIETVLSAVEELTHHQRQRFVEAQEVITAPDAGDLHQQIMVARTRNQGTMIHDRVGFHPSPRSSTSPSYGTLRAKL